MIFVSPYFLQTKQWADFWVQANTEGHAVYHISCQTTTTFGSIELLAFVYQYPWYFKQKFLYIPRGPFLQKPETINPSKAQITELLKHFLDNLMNLAEKISASFVKLDFDDNLMMNLGIKDNEELELFLKKDFENYNFNFNAQKIQYLQTPVLDCQNLTKTSYQAYLDKEVLTDFFQKNTDFWATVNQTTRRNTRKSLEHGWFVSSEKTLSNFESFWNIILKTSKKQGFYLHSKNYYYQLFKQDFSHILILNDVQQKAQAAWLGVNLNKSLVYLYGGNLEDSRKFNGQYFLHLAALYLAANQNCLTYDLGGYETGSGYGKFKEGYKGYMKTFLGPTDIVTKPIIYKIVNMIIRGAKTVKNSFKFFVNRQMQIGDLVFKFLVAIVITTCLPFWLFNLWTYLPSNFNLNLSEFKIAVVFGAGIYSQKLYPTLILKNRLDAAIDLYKQSKVRTILVSGDNRQVNYNEPMVMKKYLVDQGIPTGVVVEDFGGRRTLDTCWRVKNVFKAQKVYIITQKFHLPRAYYNCTQVGLEVIPVPAKNSIFDTTFKGVIREIPANWLAVQDSLRGYEPPVQSDGTEPNLQY